MFDRLNHCEALGPWERVLALSLARAKKKHVHSSWEHTLFKTLHALENDVSEGYQWNVKIISPEQRQSDNH